jgi:error-prone DNA polymerase
VAAPYAELHARSYHSLLDGASPPEDLVVAAAELEYQAIGVADVDGVGGLPRAFLAARQLGVPLLCGTELTVAEDLAAASARKPASAGRIVLLALDLGGWEKMCRLVTAGRLRHPKGTCCVAWDEVAGEAARGLVALSGGRDGPVDRALDARDLGAARRWAARLRDAFGDRGYLELTHHLRPGDDQRLDELARLAHELHMPRVVTQDARYARAAARPLHDVLTCVRHKTALASAGRLLAANGDAHLQPIAELRRRFASYPDALARAAEIAGRVRFSLDELRYRFPAFPDLPDGETPFSYLHDLTMQGARRRYRPMTARVSAQLAKELGVIERMKLAGYFLIVWDIVRFCNEQKILVHGRGSAANSAVCYALGITAVDPVGMDLLFERFLSEDRTEMPDIDLDIAHQRREEVIQYVYRRYGRDRTAMANEVITYRMRSAIRDVGKTFGLSLAQVDALAKAHDLFVSDGRVHEPSWKELASSDAARVAGLDPRDRTIASVLRLSQELAGFPRHLGIHSGGMVIADGHIGGVVPIENAAMEARTVTQWDKDDLNQLGIIKIDLLGLGMLTVIDEAFRLIALHEGTKLDLASIPPDDPEVYDLICAADTVGVFQIESRAQMSMLPRLKPRSFYDLVVEVAIIRPGPIQGDMVHPYLKRRNGEEPVVYAHPSLEPVLARTLGVPLFQEQGMKLAITAAGFTPGEADELRRAMGHKRSHERMAALKERLYAGMARHGIPQTAAENIYKQLSAFADYGFPESHAASFALLVYASCWLKRHHHAAFTAALLNAQPMGFYSPATLVSDARRHHVTVLPVCARRSAWLATLEPDPQKPTRQAVRLGMTTVRGTGEATRPQFEAARAAAPFRSVGDFARRSGLLRVALERLAGAGGFAAFGLRRREALWQIGLYTAASDRPLDVDPEPQETQAFPAMTPREELAADWVGLGLSIEGNPIALARPALDERGVKRARDLARARHGERTTVAGLVIIRQRPPTAKGMVFITLEDETGLANLILTPDVYERLRPVARDELLVVASGKVERAETVVNLRVLEMHGLDDVTNATPGHKSWDFR